MKPALLIIDMQHDFVNQTGAIPCRGAPEVVPTIRKLAERARAAGVPVVYTKEIHRPQKVDFGRELDGSEPLHCVEGTRGAEIVGDLTPHEEDLIIYKRRYSGFFSTDLGILLKGLGVDTVYLTGVATDVCVHYTAIDAHQLDFKVRIVEDCVAGTSREAHQAALAAIERLQSGSIITSLRAEEDFESYSQGKQVRPHGQCA